MNMSYCRFENTFRALQQCQADFDKNGNEELSQTEAIYRAKLIELCGCIVDDHGEEQDLFITDEPV